MSLIKNTTTTKCFKMRFTSFVVFCTVFFSSKILVEAQVVGFGRCPKIEAPEFKIDKFLGKWYEIERSFYLYEIPTKCTVIELDKLDNERTTNEEIRVTVNSVSRWRDKPFTSLGKMTLSGAGSSIMNYKVDSRLPSIVARFLPGSGKYQVLSTDYETYALVFSCSEHLLLHSNIVWLMGRKPEIPVWARAEAYEKLLDVGLGINLTLTNRKNCSEKI